MDRSRYEIADNFSRQILEVLPTNAHLVATDDNILFSLMYLHHVENIRPDINLIMQGVGSAELPPISISVGETPLFFTHHPNWNIEGISIVPVGMIFQACDPDEDLPMPLWEQAHLNGEDVDVARDYLTQNLIGHFHYMQGVTYEKRDWGKAHLAFQRAAKTAPQNDVLFYNLGLIYHRNDLLQQAMEFFQRSDEINSRVLASKKKQSARHMILQVRSEIDRVKAIEQRNWDVKD